MCVFVLYQLSDILVSQREKNLECKWIPRRIHTHVPCQCSVTSVAAKFSTNIFAHSLKHLVSYSIQCNLIWFWIFCVSISISIFTFCVAVGAACLFPTLRIIFRFFLLLLLSLSIKRFISIRIFTSFSKLKQKFLVFYYFFLRFPYRRGKNFEIKHSENLCDIRKKKCEYRSRAKITVKWTCTTTWYEMKSKRKLLLKIQENEEEEKEAAAKDFDSFSCHFLVISSTSLSFPWIQIKQQINRFNVIHSNAYRAFHFFSK